MQSYKALSLVNIRVANVKLIYTMVIIAHAYVSRANFLSAVMGSYLNS